VALSEPADGRAKFSRSLLPLHALRSWRSLLRQQAREVEPDNRGYWVRLPHPQAGGN